MMTSQSWTRPAYRTAGYDNNYPVKSTSDAYNVPFDNRYDSYSPTTKRKMIAKLEHRLSELRENSESMALKLGRAEKTLRDLKLEDSKLTTADDAMSDDSLFHDDVTRRHRRNPTDRDALRLEIARLREDLRQLRRETTPATTTAVRDDTLRLPRHYASRDDDYLYGSSYRKYHDDYDTTVNDDRLEYRRTKTFFDDNDYTARYRVDAPFAVPSTCCSGTGLRSSFSRPITTQHNRTRMASPTYNTSRWSDGFDTTDLRTFKPYAARDLTVGDVVKFRRTFGKMERGRVMYIGHLPGKSEAFLGVELETNTGNHDGMYNGFRYFQCKPNRGLFIPFDNVVLAWGGRV